MAAFDHPQNRGFRSRPADRWLLPQALDHRAAVPHHENQGLPDRSPAPARRIFAKAGNGRPDRPSSPCNSWRSAMALPAGQWKTPSTPKTGLCSNRFARASKELPKSRKTRTPKAASPMRPGSSQGLAAGPDIRKTRSNRHAQGVHGVSNNQTWMETPRCVHIVASGRGNVEATVQLRSPRTEHATAFPLPVGEGQDEGL